MDGDTIRVLFMSDCPYTPNSLGKITYWITRGLQERGYNVINVCPAGFTTLWEHGIRWKPNPLKDPMNDKDRVKHGLDDEFIVYPWTGSLEYLVENLKPDVVFLYGTPYGPPLAEALAECGQKGYLCTGYFLNESWILIPEYALHSANAPVFTVPTEYVRRTFIEGMASVGLPRELLEERITVSPHGLPEYIYREYGKDLIEDDAIIIGSFFKNHIRKDVSVLIRAFSRLEKEAYERAKLFVTPVSFAGDNSWNLELLVRYAELETGRKLTERILTINDIQSTSGLTEYEVASIYKTIDIFVFPSKGEAFGLPPLESALAVKPILVTDMPVFREVWSGLGDECFIKADEIVVNEAYGLYQPRVDDLAYKLSRLILDDKLRRRCGEEAYRIARKYTVDRMIDGIEGIIEKAIEIGFDPLNKYIGKKEGS